MPEVTAGPSPRTSPQSELAAERLAALSDRPAGESPADADADPVTALVAPRMPNRLVLLASRWAARLRQRWIPCRARARRGDGGEEPAGTTETGRLSLPRSRKLRLPILVVLLSLLAALGALSVTAWALSGRQNPQEHVPTHVEPRPGEAVVDGAAESVPSSPVRTSRQREAREHGDETRNGGAGLVISVVGKVAEPGLVTVPAGSRVADAVEAAGGQERGADLMEINLARRLTDGEQIYVGVPAPPGMAPGPGAPGEQAGGQESGPVHLNRASPDELETLPGVGEVTAGRIVEWRERHGEFTAVEQLREVQGIGESRLDSLRDKVAVG